MARSFARARYGMAVVTAFLCGLIFASALDLTPFGHAQQGQPPRQDQRPVQQEVRPLLEVSNAFVAIAQDVTPAVVSIQSVREQRTARRGTQPRAQPPGLEDLFRQFEEDQNTPREGSGSGFVVSNDGYILTNHHVVADADRVTVRFVDDRIFQANVVGSDPTTDIAVLKIEGRDLPLVRLGDDTQMRIGDWVLAIGNPLGLDFTVTAGIVSAKGRSIRGLLPPRYAITDYIQTDAAINPGNSGGPLVNIRGEVIGINSAIASQTGFNAGYGFAIPVTLAKQVMDELIEYGRVRPPILGVSIDEVDAVDARAAGLEEVRGVKVHGYGTAGSPAERAGIVAGDIIISAAGRSVDRVSTLQRIVRGHKPGETVPIEVMRFGKKMTFQVRLGELEPEPAVATTRGRTPAGVAPEPVRYEKLGLTAEALPTQLLQQVQRTAEQGGVLVTNVSATGPAYGRLQARDIIVEVVNPGPRRPIRTVADLERVMSSLKSGDYVTLMILRAAVGYGESAVVNLQVD
ncbi:MAG TPA: trypsin-like peptidase domain-containing protein [Gemmatimonadaceae bacterium]|nr:trypsin-like peptidase domain-containing protein [Gemmatimonadaceae bacterium]